MFWYELKEAMFMVRVDIYAVTSSKLFFKSASVRSSNMKSN